MILGTRYYIHRLCDSRETATHQLLSQHLTQLDETAIALKQERAWRYNNYIDALERLEKELAGDTASSPQTRAIRKRTGESTNHAI